LILETLMIPLGVIARHELMDGMSKRGLPEKDHSVQTLGLY